MLCAIFSGETFQGFVRPADGLSFFSYCYATDFRHTKRHLGFLNLSDLYDALDYYI